MADVGRPLRIKTPEEFNRLADAYFDKCEEKGERPLYTGLILALGLSAYQSLDRYGLRPEFSESVSRAKLRVSIGYEAATVGQGSPQGAMFVLKNIKAGAETPYWRDKQEIEHSGSIQTGIEAALDAARQQLEKEPEEPEQTD